MAKLVANTYGDALFEVAVESGQVDEYLEEVRSLKEILLSNADLFKLMNHPKISKDEKIKVVEDIFTNQLKAELVGLLRMIVDKGHFEELTKVLDYFIDKVKEYKNIGTAFVTTAAPLRDEQKKAVEKRLLETTKYVEFEMHYAVNPELIGGMVIRIGDRVVDSSVKTKLYDLTKDLSKIQLKAGECAS